MTLAVRPTFFPTTRSPAPIRRLTFSSWIAYASSGEIAARDDNGAIWRRSRSAAKSSSAIDRTSLAIIGTSWGRDNGRPAEFAIANCRSLPAQQGRLRDEMLFDHHLHEGFERRAVRLDPIRPGIAAEYLVDLLDVVEMPGEHRAGRGGETIAPDRPLLRLDERLVQAGRDPRSLFIDVAAYRD